MAESPPAPKAILRGHKAQVHAATFIRQNERLITGDAEGYVVLWDLTIMRPRAVWRAHESAILGIKGWGDDKIITHGRDNKLIAWKLGPEDEERLSTALPLEDVPVPRPQPWVLHLLPVNTMNFCSFAACSKEAVKAPFDLGSLSDIFVAVPHTLASEAIDIYSLPSQDRVHTIKTDQKNGMAMSLALFHHRGSLTLLAAFENGFASVHRLDRDNQWTMTYRSQAHSQPILSLDVPPSLEYFLTSAADAIVAKHPIPTALQEVSAPSTPTKPWEHPLKTVNTKHSGQQSLRVRSDGKIFATAGWDSNARVYSSKTMKELAVLQWHKVGCYAIAIADVVAPDSASQPGATSQSPSNSAEQTSSKSSSVIVKQSMSVKDRRLQQAKTAHWIAAGAKDGKVSLWDIY